MEKTAIKKLNQFQDLGELLITFDTTKITAS